MMSLGDPSPATPATQILSMQGEESRRIPQVGSVGGHLDEQQIARGEDGCVWLV